jgi:hypothetical protein
VTRVWLTPDRIIRRSPIFSTRQLKWEDVRELHYSRINGWFVLRSWTGSRLRVSRYLVGILAFIKAARHHRPVPELQKLAEVIELIECGRLH